MENRDGGKKDRTPVKVKVPDKATPDCWVQIFEDEDFGDNTLIVWGPAQYNNLRDLPNGNNKNWGDQIDSLITGPSCWLQVFADEDFEDTSEWFGPNSQIRHLGGMGDEIDSIRIYDHPPTAYFGALRRKVRSERT